MGQGDPGNQSPERLGFPVAPVLCVIYVLAFWGEAARLLPSPLDAWYALPFRTLGAWWRIQVVPGLGARDQVALFQLAEAVLLGFLLPTMGLQVAGRRLGEVGLRAPDRGSGPLTAWGIALCIPVGFYLSHAVAEPWGSIVQESAGMLAIMPEHFLLFGVFAALLLPGGCLPGLAVGTDRHVVVAAFACAGLFGAVHVGVADRVVLLCAFPLGLINAWLTLRTGSIWPAIYAHWALNLAPMAWDTLTA